MNTITLNIIEDEDLEDVYQKYTFIEDNEHLYFDLKIDVYNMDTYKSLIESIGDIKESIYEHYQHISYSRYVPIDEDEKSRVFCNKLINMDDNELKRMLNDIEYIHISGSYYDINDFIKNNKELLNKKIVINKTVGYSEEEIKELEDSFDTTENIYVISEGNKDAISFNDYKKTNDIIEKISKRIKQYDFSPLEQLLYLYDIVRDKVYRVEPEGESNILSRDLTKVLLGEYRVCSGFANIFNAVAERLGFRTKVIIINDRNSEYAHARNLVYINDKKYKLDGLYHFDTTGDCKRENMGNSHFSSYRYFAKTKKQIKRYDKAFNRDFDDDYMIHNYTLIKFGTMDISDNCILNLNLDYKEIRNINDHSRLVDDKTIINAISINESKEELISDLNRYVDMYERPIEPLSFIKAFYTVRKQQYYEDPDKFPLSLDIIERVLSKSGFISSSIEEMNLLCSILNTNNPYTEVLSEFNDDGKIEKDIQGVKLSKVLRKIYESKK